MTQNNPIIQKARTVEIQSTPIQLLFLLILLLTFTALSALDDKAPWRFHGAVRAGDLATVQRMVQEGFDIQNLDAGGVSGLHYAAAYGHIELVKYFLDQGLDIEQKTEGNQGTCGCGSGTVSISAGSTPLLIAASRGDEGVVSLLLKRGADAQATDAMNRNFLHAAAAGGNIRLLGDVLQRGFPINGLDQENRPPLYNAVNGKHSEAAIWLLEHRASPTYPTNSFFEDPIENILGTVIYQNLPKVFSWLLEHDIMAKLSSNQLIKTIESALDQKRIDMARELIQRAGAAIDRSPKGDFPFYTALLGDQALFEQTLSGWNDWPMFRTFIRYIGRNNLALLHAAALGGNPKIVQTCLDHGLPIDLVVSEEKYSDETALFKASERGDQMMVDYLLSQGASLKNPRTSTLLHAAAEGGLIPLAERLLKAGMDINARDSSEQTPLICAAGQEKGYEMTEFLLKKGADIDAHSEDDESAVIMAAYMGSWDTLELLLAKGASLKGIPPITLTPLNRAVRKNDIAMVERFLAAGADINASQKYNGTALHVAVEQENLNMIQFLLNRGADPRIPCEKDGSLLHSAVTGGSRRMIDFLLRLGLSLHEGDQKGQTPIFRALHSLDLVKYLLAKGADAKVKGKGDWTLLHEACGSAGMLTINKDQENTAVLEYLIGLGLDVNAQTFEISESTYDIVHTSQRAGITPLYNAVVNGLLECVKILIAHGAKFSDLQSQENSLLDSVIRNGNLEMVKFLIAHGADPMAEHYGKTPLLLAIEENQTDIATYLRSKQKQEPPAGPPTAEEFHATVRSGNLQTITACLDRGMAIDTADKQGRSALFMAIESGHEEVVRLLLERGARIDTRDKEGKTPLHAAIEGYNRRSAIVGLLLQRGADVNAQSDSQETTLHLAAKRGDTQTMTLLIEKGAQIEVPMKQKPDDFLYEDGFTPLMVAVWQGELAAAQLLLQKGADIRVVSTWGETLLHLACSKGMVDIARQVIAQGVTVDAQDQQGETALLKAVWFGEADLIKFLLEKGAQIGHRDHKGWTALHVLANTFHSSLETAQILLDAKADINATTTALVESNELAHGVFGAFPAGSTPLDVAYEALHLRYENQAEKWALIDFLKKHGAVAKTCQEPERKR